MRVLNMVKRLFGRGAPVEPTPPPVLNIRDIELPPVRVRDINLPPPPSSDPVYHTAANRYTVTAARLRLLEHAAYARAEARSITNEMEDERHA